MPLAVSLPASLALVRGTHPRGRRQVRLRLEGMVAVNGNRFPYETLNRLELAALLLRHERDRGARLARARRPADAVNIRFRLERQLHVYDARDVGNVDAARGDVGRDKYAHVAAAEPLERARALALRLVGVDCGAGDTGPRELLHDAVRAVAHLREDDNPVPFGMLFEEMREKRVLLALRDEHHLLVDLLDRRRLRRDRDGRWIVDEFASELEDRRRHRRGEEKRLARLRELRDYAPDVWEEAHVEHAVCFVENEAFNLVEIEYSLVHQVYEPPRASDDSLRALLDVLDLPILADAPD